jgi:hypothetical protein
MNYADMLSSLMQQQGGYGSSGQGYGARGLLQPVGDVVQMPILGQTNLTPEKIAQLRALQRKHGLSDNQMRDYIGYLQAQQR